MPDYIPGKYSDHKPQNATPSFRTDRRVKESAENKCISKKKKLFTNIIHILRASVCATISSHLQDSGNRKYNE